MIPLKDFIGLEYGNPYNCFELVKEIRKRMGMQTPTVADVDPINSYRHILKNIKSGLWQKRPHSYNGFSGDIMLMSRLDGVPYHHCGVVVGVDVIHVDVGVPVSALPIGRVQIVYPGQMSRWFYAG